MLSYKGYIGTAEYSSEDKVFWGKIHGINALITFEAESAKDLEKNFQAAVDDYLETCREESITPEKVFKGNFNVRIRPQLHKALYLRSKAKKISINKMIEGFIEKEIA